MCALGRAKRVSGGSGSDRSGRDRAAMRLRGALDHASDDATARAKLTIPPPLHPRNSAAPICPASRRPVQRADPVDPICLRRARATAGNRADLDPHLRARARPPVRSRLPEDQRLLPAGRACRAPRPEPLVPVPCARTLRGSPCRPPSIVRMQITPPTWRWSAQCLSLYRNAARLFRHREPSTPCRGFGHAAPRARGTPPLGASGASLGAKQRLSIRAPTRNQSLGRSHHNTTASHSGSPRQAAAEARGQQQRRSALPTPLPSERIAVHHLNRLCRRVVDGSRPRVAKSFTRPAPRLRGRRRARIDPSASSIAASLGVGVHRRARA